MFVMSDYHVTAFWDEEAKVWVASSDDVPGLATEAETVECLLDKLRSMIPELLEINGQPMASEIPFQLHTDCVDLARWN
jgi:predicted RNase H-like HicB family nuclease